MKWELRMTPAAIKGLYAVNRRFVRNVSSLLDTLAEDFTTLNLQVDEDDPSVYWLPVEGDYTIFFEILDSEYAIRILTIK